MTGGCAADKGEGVAIYLTRDNVPPDRMELLSHVEIAAEPVIAPADIIAYNAQTHELQITPAAYERITELEVTTTGKSFLVCLDKAPVYWGAFWTSFSSQAFDGITIWQPLRAEEPYVITLELGYPSSSFYGGEDPRSNPAITAALERAGKLVNKLTIADIEALPRSMKGYELYSWSAGGRWHFTLITGTNRNKTMAEITTGEDFISETGWISIHVTGEDAIKDVLSRLPPGEPVCWCGELHIGEITGTDIKLQLPPDTMVDAIEEPAGQRGLDFLVAAH
jgi:hypothetical protein